MIYTTKGPVNSALVNLETDELRTTKSKELGKVSWSNKNEQAIKRNYAFLSCFDFQTIDIILSKTTFKKISRNLDLDESAFNIRIVDKGANIKSVIQLIKDISEYCVFFALVFVSKKKEHIRIIENRFDWVVVRKLNTGGGLKKRKFYQPNFMPTSFAILISENSNLYFHSRLTYLISDISVTRNNNYENDIPKNKIDICSVCEFRRVCIDPRPVLKKNKKYFYEQKCKYDPYKGEWLD